MSQKNILNRERATYVGEEIGAAQVETFGVAPTAALADGSFPTPFMTRCFPLGDNLIVGDLAEEMLPVMDEKVRRMDASHPVHGLKIASKVGGLKCLLKATPSTGQLTDAAVFGANTSLTPRLLLRHAFGSEHAAVGSTISGALSSTTSVDVVDGSVFKKGSFIAVQTGAALIEWAKVTNVATNTLTVYPPLSAAPTTPTWVVRNLYNYAPAETNSKSLCIQQKFVGGSGEETSHTYNGCYGDLSFDLPEPGKLPSMTLSMTATNYTLGGTLTTGVGTDEMGAAAHWAPSIYLAPAITRIAPLVNEGCTIEMKDTVELVRDPSATQTVSSIVRTGGNPAAVKLGVKLRFDSTYDASFTVDTAYECFIVQKIGTDLTASFWIFHVPVAKLVAPPKRVNVGSRLHMELAFAGYQDDIALAGSPETGADLDFIRSPLTVAFG